MLRSSGVAEFGTWGLGGLGAWGAPPPEMNVLGLLFSHRRASSCHRRAFRAEKEVGASLRPLPCLVGARCAAGVRIRRCLPLRGKSASELARRILAGSRERVFCGGVLPIRKLSRRAGETELRGTSHRLCFSRRIFGARHTVETGFSPFTTFSRPQKAIFPPSPPRLLPQTIPRGDRRALPAPAQGSKPLRIPFLGTAAVFPAAPVPLLVGRACVESEPTAPAGGTAAS